MIIINDKHPSNVFHIIDKKDWFLVTFVDIYELEGGLINRFKPKTNINGMTIKLILTIPTKYQFTRGNCYILNLEFSHVRIGFNVYDIRKWYGIE